MRHGALLLKKTEQFERSISLGLSRLPDIIVDDNALTIANAKSSDGSAKKYVPSPTGRLFHEDTSMVRAIIGPVGSGKSTACLFQLLKRALSDSFMCKDGVRRYKCVIVRNTYPELKTTTIASFLTWFGSLGKMKYDSPISFHADFHDEKGRIIFDAFFISLDRDEDFEKVSSAEFSDGYMNEARGFSGEKISIILNEIVKRCGRYPRKQELMYPDIYSKNVYLDTNPPATEHWFYNIFEVEKPKEYKLFKQPSGLIKIAPGQYITNPEAENLENLEDDYYVKATYGNTEENINVQLMGNYGTFLIGERVYKSYNDDLHSSNSISFTPGIDVIIGFDFGTTPAAVFTQLLPTGHLNVIHEIYDDNSDLETFLENAVKPFIEDKLPSHEYPNIIAVGDPSGVARGNTARNCFNIIEDALGITAIRASTNAIDLRLGAVNSFLCKMVNGSPCYKISRAGCTRLRAGKNGGYQMTMIGGKKTPEKNLYSHISDAEQYAALYHKPNFGAEPTPKKKFMPKVITGSGFR